MIINGVDYPVVSVSTEIDMSYVLEDTSAGGVCSIDRGISSDQYLATLTISGDEESVLSFRNNTVAWSRTGNASTIAPKMPIFGDHIDHGFPVPIVFVSLGTITNTGLGTASITATIRHLAPQYVGVAQLPTMQCLQTGQSSAFQWSGRDVASWDGASHFTDRKNDLAQFYGEYLLSPNDCRDLLRWWSVFRGSTIQIQDGDFGAREMFGREYGDGIHYIVVDSMVYDYRSPALRSVRVSLRRTNNNEV